MSYKKGEIFMWLFLFLLSYLILCLGVREEIKTNSENLLLRLLGYLFLSSFNFSFNFSSNSISIPLGFFIAIILVNRVRTKHKMAKRFACYLGLLLWIIALVFF